MTLVNTLVVNFYYLLSAFIALVLIRSIIKTRDAQEAILFCIILMPFLLRALHVK